MLEPIPDIHRLAPTDPLTRAQVVALLASGIPSRGIGEDERVRRERVRSRMRDHLRRGLIQPASPGTFLLGEVARWVQAQNDWSGCFDKLLSRHLAESAAKPSNEHATDDARCLAIVKRAVEDHNRATGVEFLANAIAEANGDISSLEQRVLDRIRRKIAALENQVRKLTPEADGYRKIREANRDNAKKRRK